MPREFDSEEKWNSIIDGYNKEFEILISKITDKSVKLQFQSLWRNISRLARKHTLIMLEIEVQRKELDEKVKDLEKRTVQQGVLHPSSPYIINM